MRFMICKIEILASFSPLPFSCMGSFTYEKGRGVWLMMISSKNKIFRKIFRVLQGLYNQKLKKQLELFFHKAHSTDLNVYFLYAHATERGQDLYLKFGALLQSFKRQLHFGWVKFYH